MSPAEDLLDLGVGVALIRLLGWHWEFLPSFLAKLVPGVDLVPFGPWPWPTSTRNRSALHSFPKKAARGLVLSGGGRPNA